MARLQGRSSNAPTLLTIALVLIAVVIVLEYLGVINLVPNFGRP